MDARSRVVEAAKQGFRRLLSPLTQPATCQIGSFPSPCDAMPRADNHGLGNAGL